jgi:hypothetical protein
MLKDRNETSHVYNEDTARRLYDSIPANYPEIRRTYEGIRDRAAKLSGKA